MSSGGNIKVVVRVRPFNSREKERQAKCIVQMKENQTVLVPPPPDPKAKSAKASLEGNKTFAFDKSYWSFDKKDSNYAGQDNLFDDLGKPLLDNAFKGYNNCIFAYGQTGSGKSYSMMGYGQEYGVIPRICKDMFERIESVQDKNLTSTVEVSYLEIYNERVRDLLNPANKGNLKVREHPSTGPYVEDLAKLAVQSFAEIENLMDEGNKARTVAATNMNETSSRSHAVFTLTLTQKRHDSETRMDTEKVAKISLVDLAGSERATSTGATGARLKEGAEINRSLSTLGRVIAALADLSTGATKKKGTLVPYRDSVLTWLLKDSLGGNSLTAMIAAISPADINFEETLSTLRYADSAKRIKNHAVVNEDPNARIIRELKEELAQLRSKLGGGGGTGPVEEQYPEGTPLDQQFVSIVQSDGSLKKVSKAEIANQISQSEKLYKDLNTTWEEKLQMTEQIHKEREAALEELGISIEKGFVGVSTPKKMPHLVNLSDDPLLAECLIYNLKPGSTTVGSMESGSTAEIRLNGSKILKDHCVFENVDNVVTLVPKENAAVMVNGQRISEPKRLRSGYRIILGDFQIFRFNHPEEARAERENAGSSNLRYSITARELSTPSPHLGHERSSSVASRADSDVDNDNSRAKSPRHRPSDSDWSFARREAVGALLGSDPKISALSDEELDGLFEDVQRIRAGRRKENRIIENEDDSDSISSFPIREKYLSYGTLDNFSLDTILTVPSTPQNHEEDQRLKLMRNEMQNQFDKQKDEYQFQLKQSEDSNVEIETIKAEKIKMEQSLQTMKTEMEEQLKSQKEQFERQIAQLRAPSYLNSNKLTGIQADRARWAIERWQQKRYVSMTEKMFQNSSLLKEAQILSNEMDKDIMFQFCVVDSGHEFCSSYDLVLTGVSLEDDDELENAPKPCIGVRVIDYKNEMISLWSLEKLRKRVRSMRQLYQYIDSPEYSQHLDLNNPFCDSTEAQYSRIGDVDVPLAAVFEARVQDFSLDVVSPYTSNVIGILYLSLEPSSALAPTNTLKFNIVMREMAGFAEREGTNIHAQLFIPGISDESGVTTTTMIKDFDEGSVRFESVHNMSLPLDSPKTTMLRISVFAKVTTMHLDKLLSWDDMRDSAVGNKKKKKKSPRIAESEYFAEEKHDVFARVQIHEIAESGLYEPLDVVVQRGQQDVGVFQLHQGLQRRVGISLTYSPSKNLYFQDINKVRISRVTLLDESGKSSDIDSPQAEVPLKVISAATTTENADGTSVVTIISQWDSSIHASPLLDRTTSDKHRVQVTLSWNVLTELQSPLTFSIDLQLQIRGRSFVIQQSMLQTFLGSQKVIHSATEVYALLLQPMSAKRAADLWRMNTSNQYVKGEESLISWTPRGVTLVQDYIKSRLQKRRIAEVESTRSVLSLRMLSLHDDDDDDDDDDNNINNNNNNNDDDDDDDDYNTYDPTPRNDPLTPQQETLLRKYLELWLSNRDFHTDHILSPNNVEPRTVDGNDNSSITQSLTTPKLPKLIATVRRVPKNPSILKSGYLLCPDSSHTRWVKRWVELRRPYLHVFAASEGDQILAINLANSRVDADPHVALLLQRPGSTLEGSMWAVFAPWNSFLFRARNQREKAEWIVRIDEGWMSSAGGSSGTSSQNGD